MNIASWGPSAWRYLHAMAFSYPAEPDDQTLNSTYAFLHYFAKTIPCRKCRQHFTEMLSNGEYAVESPESPFLSCRYNFAKWTVDVHNVVNKRTNKRIWTFDEVSVEYGSVDGSLCSLPSAGDKDEKKKPSSSWNDPSSPLTTRNRGSLSFAFYVISIITLICIVIAIILLSLNNARRRSAIVASQSSVSDGPSRPTTV